MALRRAVPVVRQPVALPPVLTVAELASKLETTGIEIIKELMKLGIMASINQQIDYDTAAKVAASLNWETNEQIPEAMQRANATFETRRAEADLIRRFDHVLTTSEADQTALLSLPSRDGKPSPLSILPGGVDLDYFRPNADLTPKIRSMVSQVDDLEYIVTVSNLEALILESNLIKKHRPKYNVVLRDDKNYPLLRLSMKDDYPRLEIVRQVRRDGALYFGPYVPTGGLYEMLRLLRKIFPLPNCTIDIDVTWAMRREKPIVAPMTTKLVASVTMKEGRLVLTTTMPLARPIAAPRRRARAIIGQIGRPKKLVPRATTIEEAPTVEPIDRSNSPAIIRRPTGMATMFEKLASQNKKKPGTLAKLFSSHPQSLDRRDASLALVARFPEKEEYIISTSEFQRVRAHLMRLTNAKAGVTTDVDDTESNRPTLKRRQPESTDPTTNPTDNPTNDENKERPQLKRRTDPSPSPSPEN